MNFIEKIVETIKSPKKYVPFVMALCFHQSILYATRNHLFVYQRLVDITKGKKGLTAKVFSLTNMHLPK